MQYANCAVLIPCYNEELTIAGVVSDFKKVLPGATIYVADNCSTDQTSKKALEAGAVVIFEPKKGKGNAMCRLFADVDADFYIMVDGDSTYDASVSHLAIRHLVENRLDVVYVNRVDKNGKLDAHRHVHSLGNAVLSKVFTRLFRLELRDTLTGYRVMSRRFVKSFLDMPKGFEIEAALNVHAVAVSSALDQMDGLYVERPIDSFSKLNTFRDGFKILSTLLRLFRNSRPFVSFCILAFPWLIVSALFLYRSISPYLETGVVEYLPSLIAGVAAAAISFQLLTIGVILERNASLRQELRRSRYLN